MTIKDTLSNGFNALVVKAGKPISIRYYSNAPDNVFDDSPGLVQSGNTLWTRGIVLPVNAKEGTNESYLAEQGKLTNYDQRLYVNGSLSFTGTSLQVKIGVGSPGTDFFSLIPDGKISPEVENQRVYSKVFIRRLPTGSLVGEN